MSVGKINNVSDSNLGKVVSLSSSNIGKIGVGLFTDEYTKLLLHMDGVGNTFIDSATNKTVNTRGNVTQSTTQSKFGGKSCYFDGDGDYLDIATSLILLLEQELLQLIFGHLFLAIDPQNTIHLLKLELFRELQDLVLV